MFCSSCGKKITENSKFCKYCGAKQTEGELKENENINKSKKSFFRNKRQKAWFFYGLRLY